MKDAYKIYFEQVNQTMYEVVAEDEDSAITKARRMWRAEYAEPCITWTEKVGESQ
jgi:hypothetical protein